jgi:hypothetical protein
MKTEITSNGKCRKFIQSATPFKANNIYGMEWTQNFYVVFSYGQHWPLFALDKSTGQWYANKSKYGVTTSKHYGQAHPLADNITSLDRDQLRSALFSALDIAKALNES